MNADDIRALYARETPATPEEAAETEADARTDPAQARRLLSVLYALASEERAAAEVLNATMFTLLMDHVMERAARDDAYALRVADLIIQQQALIAQRARAAKVPRGKRARTA